MTTSPVVWLELNRFFLEPIIKRSTRAVGTLSAKEILLATRRLQLSGGLETPRERKKMRTQIFTVLGLLVVTIMWQLAALGADKERTIIGEGQCAKCALHETKSCQNAITVLENGKKVTYYLTENQISKDFHDNLCKSTAKVRATGTVNESQGKLELTPTKIELIKD